MVLVKRTLVTLVAVVLVLGGCSPSDDGPAAAEPAAETSAPAGDVALVDLCPEVEVVLNERVPTDEVMDGGDYQVLRGHLEPLAETGDTEAANAVGVLVRSVNDAIESLMNSDGDYLAARAHLRAGVRTFAERCRVVGSSALQ